MITARDFSDLQIPYDDIPKGLEWIQRQGTTGIQLLDDNHWELWSPEKFNSLSPEDLLQWWKLEIAPQLAEKATNWTVIKP